jgi:hypothetical protein
MIVFTWERATRRVCEKGLVAAELSLCDKWQ